MLIYSVTSAEQMQSGADIAVFSLDISIGKAHLLHFIVEVIISGHHGVVVFCFGWKGCHQAASAFQIGHCVEEDLFRMNADGV